MSEIYNLLELCLQDIEKGASMDAVLSRYPEHAAELRPLLETAMRAIRIRVEDPSSDVIRQNRARVLQHAAELREAKAKSSRRLWSVPLRRTLVTLVVIVALFMSSTNLVRAASTTLPGDQLYPVKRTWEDVLVTFTFNVQSRNALEIEHENERLNELSELFAKGRSVLVDFSGMVTRQNGDLWLIAGIPVAVSAQTDFSNQTIVIGNAVHVVGITQKDGAVLAAKIELLPSGVPLPQVSDDDSSEIEHENSGPSNQPGEDNSGRGSDSESPQINVTQTPNPESESGSSHTSEPKDQTISGVVQSINGNIVVVDGQIMNLSTAQEVKGTPKVGASVKVEGYYDANGLFIVTKIEFDNSGSSGESTSGSNDRNNDSGSNDSGGNTSGGDDHGGDSGGSGGDDGGSSGGDGGTSGGGGD